MKYTKASKKGGDLYDKISKDMLGRISTTKAGCQILAEIIARVPGGTHVEIGTLWGGTAILAALMQNDDGVVIAIDPITDLGYYGQIDPIVKKKPTRATMKKNFRTFGVEYRISHIDKKSTPFPLNGCVFDTAFIDGDHTYPTVYHDWLAVRDRARCYVIFDNVADGFPDVQLVFDLACNDPNWRLFVQAAGMGVVERIPHDPES